VPEVLKGLKGQPVAYILLLMQRSLSLPFSVALPSAVLLPLQGRLPVCGLPQDDVLELAGAAQEPRQLGATGRLVGVVRDK